MEALNNLSKVDPLNSIYPIRLLLIIKLLLIGISTYAQTPASPTPIFVILTTPTPFVEQAVATVTPTFTPTPVGVVLLEVKEGSGGINVRTEPGPEADQLGTISFGTLYPVYRQFYSWYEIEFELSPNRRGWIYGEFVDIIGDSNEIEFIEDFNWATPQGSLSSATEESDELGADSVSSTPVTRQLDAPATIESANQTPTVQLVLPTYTYPPSNNTTSQIALRSEVSEDANQNTATEQMPPLLPILLLGGAGMIGLLFDSLRG